MAANPGEDGPAALVPRRARWVPLAVFAVFVAIAFTGEPPTWPFAIPAALVALGAAAVLVDQRPPVLLLGYAALATAGIAVLCDGTASNVGWFAVCLLGGWCMLLGGRRVGTVYWAGAMVLFVIEWVANQPDPGWAAWMAGTTLTTLAGLLIRHEIELVAQLRAAQAGLAARARAEERNHIARELHDVIAHTLTVSLLHVTSARLAVEFDPADAARSLAEAERLGRESLAEVRSAVGLLRQDGDSASSAPLPGVGDLPALVQRFASAGTDVAFTVTGDVDRLHTTTGLALYRIAQEALTNAVKHAAGAPAAMALTIDSGAAVLTIDSAAPPGSGVGLGLNSMRERAESLGGTCTAGPGGHGWLVQASLPVDSARRTDPLT